MTLATGKYAMVKPRDGCSNDQQMPQPPVSAACAQVGYGVRLTRVSYNNRINCLVALNLQTKSRSSLVGPNVDRGS